MKREDHDRVWALMSILFGVTSWALGILVSKPYENLNLLFICTILAALLGVIFGIIAFIKKSLRIIALLGILVSVLYFLAAVMTFMAIALRWGFLP